MSLQRAMRRVLSLILVLSVGLWAEGGLAMLSAASHAPQCHAARSHAHHAAVAMPCCPSHAALALVHFINPPPCCDLSNQPARPLAFVVVPGKFRSGQLSASGAAAAMFVLPQAGSALSLIGASPPFVKPVFDLKTDLRI
jgi:hypothetical protein